MFLNNYSVRVVDGKEEAGGYVLMQHGCHYSLVLRNNNSTRCNARVEIDGKHQGTWRIPPKDAISIERPAHDSGLFTFYEANSKEGVSIGLSKDDPTLGVVSVTFTPEKTRHSPEVDWGAERGAVSYGGFSKGSSRSAGGTGLSGRSLQAFGNAEEMELDESSATTINLRLVADASNNPRPLTAYSNPVPPPIR